MFMYLKVAILQHSWIAPPQKSEQKVSQVTLQGVSRVSVLDVDNFCNVWRGRRTLWTRSLPPPPQHLNVNSGLIIQSSLPWISVDNSPVVSSSHPCKMWPEWSMTYFLDLKYFLISNLARTQRKLIFNRCVCSYICMVFVAVVLLGRLPTFSTPE